jgi:hypothetical protein
MPNSPESSDACTTPPSRLSTLITILAILCTAWVVYADGQRNEELRRQCDRQGGALKFDQAHQRPVCVKPGTPLDPPVR